MNSSGARAPCLWLALFSLAALRSDAGQLPGGVAVYYDISGSARSGPISPGQRRFLSVRLENLTLPFGDGLTGVQFGLDIDPRLRLLNAFPTGDAFFPAEVAPGEWLIGLSQCKPAPISQYVLMLLEVEIAAGTSDVSDLRVGVRDLTQFGERMGYTHCLDISHFSRFYDAGDVLLNPSTPSIMHLSAAPDYNVRGRGIQLGWDAVGTTTLDGAAVGSSGTRAEDPQFLTTYTLEASSGAFSVQSQRSVEVIDRPRVESFTATVTELQPVPKAQLRWEVSGATSVQIEAVPGVEHEIGRALVVITDPPIWQLQATNEWGTTTAVAAIEDQIETLPPLILDLTVTPTNFAPGTPIQVTWAIFNADSAELLPQPGAVDPVQGTVELYLDTGAEITLLAHNANGTVTRSVPVSLAQVYIDAFIAEPDLVYGGFPTRLSWSLRNAASARIDPEPGEIDPSAGFVDIVPPAEGSIYTLTASNAEHTSFATRTIGWKPPDASFSVAPELVQPQTPFDVQLEIDGALSASLLPFPGAISPQSQTLQLSLDETTDFELRVQNLAGETVVTRQIRVGPPEIQLSAISPDGGPWTDEPFALRAVILAADQATLEPGFGTIANTGGDFSLTISSPTLFVCTASNALGTSIDSLYIEPLVFSAQLTASTTEPYAGFPYTLTATIVGAESAALTPFGSISPTGGTFQTHATTPRTHTLTAQRAARIISQVITITPKRPDILRFEVLNPPATVGQPFQIAVALAGATSATLLPGGAISPTGGTFSRTILVPTTYTLTANNAAGSTSQQLLVTPVGLRVELSASTATPYGGRTFTLNALLEDAESATLEPGFGAIDPAGGTFEASVTVPTTFTLTGHSGTTHLSDSVNIVPQKPGLGLTASNTTPFPDETITLNATILGADTASLNPGFGDVAPQSAAFTTQVPVTTVFTLSATNPTGTTQVTRTVTPKPPRFSNNPTVSPASILFGESASLQWNADHFDQLTIEPIGHSTSTWGVGSLSVSPTATTTYTFSATNSAGTTTRSTTLQVVPFRIVSFTASPTHTESGQPVELAWVVLGTASVELVGIGPQPLVGSLLVTPTQTVSYTLRVSQGAWVQQRTVTILVGGAEGPGIFLSFDPDEIPGPYPSPSPFTLYTVWVVARNVAGGLSGYEVQVTTPPCESIIGVSLYPPNALNVGQVGNYIVGLGFCQFDTDFPLISMQMFRGTVGCESLPFQLGGTSPSSFGGLPGYASCGSDLVPFEVGPPLFTHDDDGGVAVALDLQVDALEDGNRLQWSIHATDTSSLRIYRRVDGSAEQLVRSLAPDDDEWLDQDIGSGRRFEYELAALIDGEELRSARKAVERELPQLAVRSRLLPNVPNPFNPSTQLRFFLARAGSANLTIHDLSGRRVWSQSTGSLPAGEHSLTWTGIDDAGRAVASGVYLVRLQGADGDDTQRIALLK